MRPPQVEASRQLPAPAAVGMPRAGEEWAQAWGGVCAAGVPGARVSD